MPLPPWQKCHSPSERPATTVYIVYYNEKKMQPERSLAIVQPNTVMYDVFQQTKSENLKIRVFKF